NGVARPRKCAKPRGSFRLAASSSVQLILSRCEPPAKLGTLICSDRDQSAFAAAHSWQRITKGPPLSNGEPHRQKERCSFYSIARRRRFHRSVRGRPGFLG